MASAIALRATTPTSTGFARRNAKSTKSMTTRRSSAAAERDSEKSMVSAVSVLQAPRPTVMDKLATPVGPMRNLRAENVSV